ncbi:MAG TPA: hypothetical protein VJN93_15330 [Candidatus Acidoferrum sp.]|nr:hypothetical protein [Candidatus Acidoferrum sp.]
MASAQRSLEPFPGGNSARPANVLVRRSHLEEDRESLVRSMKLWLSSEANERRYDWLYRFGPHGEAAAWLAVTPDGATIGGAAAFPRNFFVDGQLQRGYVLGDFFVAPEFRTLGPALQLQRACLAGVRSASMTLFYDFPAPAMVPVYRRLAMAMNQQMMRLAKPLRLDRKFGSMFRAIPAAKRLAPAGNRIMQLLDGRARSESGCRISRLEGRCGEEFSALARTVGSTNGICVERSASYLNWRYLEHFSGHYEILTANRNDTLVAYLVFAQEGDDAEVADLFGAPDTSALSDLLRATVSLLRERGVVTVSAQMLASHPWLRIFKAAGFRERESRPALTFHSLSVEGKQQAIDSPWYLMQGDRES